jgi:subtilisin family serine protease
LAQLVESPHSSQRAALAGVTFDVKIVTPRFIAAAILAGLAIALVINAGPWPSFARLAGVYLKPHSTYSKHETKTAAERSASTLDEARLKSADARRTNYAFSKPTPGIAKAASRSTLGEILVRFRATSNVSRNNVKQLRIAARAGQIDVELVRLNMSHELVEGLRLAKVPAEQQETALAALRSRSDVLYAEPNYIWQLSSTLPNDPRFGEQWGLRSISPNSPDTSDINADKAWDITTGDSSVVVAVIDGGVDINHEDLRDNIFRNAGEIPDNGLDDDGDGFIDDIQGWDFYHNDNRVFDNEPGDDHATHVAGILGARGNNGVGVSGVCWRVTMLPIKALGPNGGSVSNIISAYSYVKTLRDRGVNIRVVNNSYGGSARSLAAEDAINQLNQSGILFVAAAGNDHRDNRKFPNYPANYALPNVIAVAATAEDFGIDPFYSNYGKPKVMLAAPGTDVLSTLPNNSYGYASGTSMAAPFVSGAAALVVAVKPDVSPAILKGALIYSRAQPQSLETEGVLDVYAAIQAANENDSIPPGAPANLQYAPPTFGGSLVGLNWTAPGDDGGVGQVVDYEVTSLTPAGKRISLPLRTAPQGAGTQQSLFNVLIPIGNPSGTLEVRAFDNVGNSNSATVPAPLNLNQSLLADPYIVTESPHTPLTTGGQRLVLNGDDQYVQYNLPFNVPMGGNFSLVSISTNGVVHCTGAPPRRNGFNDDFPSSIEYLTGQPMIAGLWDDLVIDSSERPDAGVYVVTPNNDTVIFRWQANTFATGGPVNFEIELRRNSTFIVRYGDGNAGLNPVVGLSYGTPQAYVVDSHTHEYWQTGSPISLSNAADVTFTQRTQPASVVFQMEHDSYEISEGGGVASIVVTRPAYTSTGFPILGTYSVDYSTSPGTALPNEDYMQVSGTLTFGTGEATKTITIPLVNDSVLEPDETLSVILSNPTNSSVLGAVSVATIRILDNDLTPVVLTDVNNHVIAIDSVTFVRDPFSVTGLHNFSSDQRTRVMIFTSNLGMTQPTAELSVTAGGIPLTVEGVGTLAGVPNVSYVIVKLDQTLTGNVQLSVTFRGVTSNTGVLNISP